MEMTEKAYPPAPGYLDQNLSAVRRRIEEAERESGRTPGETLLLAAVKSGSVGEINYLHRELGVEHIGENRVQQLLARYDDYDKEGLTIHFIGSLQKNKVKYIIDKVAMIHSVDSLSLGEEINRRAAARGIVMPILVEVNSGEEEAKGGVAPSDAEALCLALDVLPNLRLSGLMTMAPRCESDEEYARYFESTRRLGETIFRDALGRSEKPILSMGMSESYVPAVKAGATIVRVGRQLFSGREHAQDIT